MGIGDVECWGRASLYEMDEKNCKIDCNALRYVSRLENVMPATPAERMRNHRARRRVDGLREIRLSVPDARSPAIREKVGKAVIGLDRSSEEDILDWIETVSEFDDRPTR